MKHRLLTLMVAGLFAAGTACAQSSKGQLCDPAKAKQYISQHPESGSSFYYDDASGQMICTDAAVYKQFSSFNGSGASKSGQFTLSASPSGTAQPAKASHALTAQPNAKSLNSTEQQEAKQASIAQQKGKESGSAVEKSAVNGSGASIKATDPYERMEQLQVLMKEDPAGFEQYNAEYQRLKQKYPNSSATSVTGH